MNRQLSYQIVVKHIGEPATPIRFVRAQCATCDRTEDFIWKSHHNPHHVSNHFKQIGWEFDKYRRSKIQCPDCLSKTNTSEGHDTAELLPKLETFGQRFRYLREHAGLKRDQVADEAKFDRRMLAWLESGEEHPYRIATDSISRLIEVLRKYNIPVDRGWLLDTKNQGDTLARNVRKAMEKWNYVETTLADRSGVPGSQIKLILSGTIPSHHRLPEIAKTLQTTPEELMGLPPKGKKVETEPVELVVLSPKLRPIRLREARQAKDLGQSRLAELIYERDKTWTIGTLKWLISRVESGGTHSKEEKLLKLAAEFLDVPEDWLLGSTDAERPERPASLQEQTGISETAAEEIVTRLARAESDLVGLNQLVDEALAPIRPMIDQAIQPIRQMAEETKSSIEEIKQTLLRCNLPRRIFVKLPGIVTPPLAAVVHKPAPAAVHKGNGHAEVNGHKPATPKFAAPKREPKFVAAPSERTLSIDWSKRPAFRQVVGSLTIDRNMESKQNLFARALKRSIRHREFNLAVIEERLPDDVIDELVPPDCKNRDGYLRALIQREVAAKNGLLVKTARGCWQFRPGAHI